MKEFSNETPSELLTQLMDNELDSVMEPALYDALASSAELQEEHKYHIAVREAIKKDSEAFTPPIATVSSLFNKLGYAPPPPAASVGILRKSPLLLMFLRKATIPLILLIAGSYGAYNLIYSSQNDDKASSQNLAIYDDSTDIAAKQSNETVIQESQNNFDKAVSKIVEAKHKTPVMTSNDISNESQSLNNAKVDYTNAIASEELNESLNANNTLTTSSKIANFGSNFALNKFNNLTPNELTPIAIDFSSSSKSNLSFYVKGMSNFNTDLGNALSNNGSSFDHFSGGVLSKLSFDNLKAGFEIGQQPFVVQVSQTDNETVLSSQVQSVFWYAATLKYDLSFAKLLNTQPFVQGSFGSGNFGKYMFRYSFGLEYQPFSTNLNLIAGYEASILWYSTQNIPLNTLSDGGFVGISFGF
jgi:hypothetical protein